MFDQQIICPYTGLRSFTEDESLYFKGRDLQVDQITSQLEKNKFLMLTGASGEGKSSLIYAGLIPNARAGFFKARYSNWVVADFRPERNPVANMAMAIGGQLGIGPSTVETELRRGYSSLIDLYTNSDFYADEESVQWQNASEEERKEKKRTSANLLIIADQFEEFFTNPENFYNEAPSQDSQIVVNLLLETARIALKKNIPVYVVCTMRSDYIGQCSAFRGLPDYIGFSQFFVPRLKRRDLKQVIEEPSVLSGNRISQRLVERLVYDLSEGLDQLPILQHALSQIWRAANEGRDEMDLLHYAKVGGMPASELPDADQQVFLKWYKTLPDHQRGYYRETGLHRVIEIHADMLYESAWQHYNDKHPVNPITREQGHRIVSGAFSCLTKIDNSRAVRNRMSLHEITEILDSPGITTQMVGDLLEIFREEGNSFIRPFRTDDPATSSISPDTVLDITHESLIRNWTRLKGWANKEFEYYSTYLDFRKQLDRWTGSGKSRSFLLPIGPLSFFEKWYDDCRPNVSWIRRYSEIEGDRDAELAKAEIILTNSREFLKSSARKVAVPRAFMKYGPKRIATVFAIILMAGLSIFYWIDAERKQNDRVIEAVMTKASGLLRSNEVNTSVKAEYLLMDERYTPGTLMTYLTEQDPKVRLTLANEVYRQVLIFNKYDKSQFKNDLRDMVLGYFESEMSADPDHIFMLNELNKFSTMLAYDHYYNPNNSTERVLRTTTDEGYALVMTFLNRVNLYRPAIPIELNYAIQQWLTFGTASADKSMEMLQVLSPFENPAGRQIFDVYYPRGSYEINGRVSNEFNGGYHTLASLYASTGDVGNVNRSFEQIKLAGQDDYFTGSLFNNYNHILAIFYQFGHRESAAPMVRWLGENYASNVPLTIYRNSVIRASYLSSFYPINIEKDYLRSNRGYFFPNLTLANRNVFNALTDDYEALIMAIPDADERNYLMAINKKRRAMFSHKYAFDRGLEADAEELEEQLEQALNYFRSTSSSFLQEQVPVTVPYLTDGVRNRQYSRRELFIYPDYFEGWFSNTFHTDLFFNFIDRNALFEEFYRTPAELDLIHLWIARVNERKPYIRLQKFDNSFPLSDDVMIRIMDLKNTHPAGPTFDLNLISLIMANRAFDEGDSETALAYYNQIDKAGFQQSRDRYEYVETTYFMNQLKNLAVNFASSGDHDEAIAIAEQFEREHEKAFAYIFMAEKIYMDNLNPIAFAYLDSALTKARRIDFSQFDIGTNTFIDIRYNLILLLSRMGGRELNQMAREFLREMIEGNKFLGLQSWIYGVAEEGNYYRAFTAMLPTLTETEELNLLRVILWQASISREYNQGLGHRISMDQYYTYNYNYIFYQPN